MKKILIIITVLLFSYSTVRSQDITGKTDNVMLTIKRKVPYCGGVKPSPEQENMTELEISKSFIIQYQQGYGDSLWVDEVKTDSLGTLKCNLPDGRYCLKSAGKKLPFDEFYKQHKKPDDKFNLYRDSSCYYNWWKRCEFSFEINDETKSIETEVLINARCFTGEDPCHIYRGPYPP